MGRLVTYRNVPVFDGSQKRKTHFRTHRSTRILSAHQTRADGGAFLEDNPSF
jgi:hypothetical protein